MIGWEIWRHSLCFCNVRVICFNCTVDWFISIHITDLSDCQLMQIPDAVYHLMRNTVLQTCDLSTNSIARIGARFAEKFPVITGEWVTNNSGIDLFVPWKSTIQLKQGIFNCTSYKNKLNDLYFFWQINKNISSTIIRNRNKKITFVYECHIQATPYTCSCHKYS